MRNNDWVGKRTAARQNCQMRAEMRFLDGNSPEECLIIDISASGCRIEMPTDAPVPEDFDLFIPSRSETKIAKVRRQDGKLLGVAFLRSRLDDPLVMQTLLERVARLERGYSELRTLRPPAGPTEHEPNQSATMPVAPGAVSFESNMQGDWRLDTLFLDLAGLRRTVNELTEEAAKAGADPAVRAAEFATEMSALKEQMSKLGDALSASTGQAYADAPTFSADLAHMKAEMLTLSIAMRQMSAEMPKTQVTVAPGGGGDGDTFQLAKLKADIAQLRAVVEVQQGGAVAAPVALAKMEEFVAVRSEIAALRERVDGKPVAVVAPEPAQRQEAFTPAEVAQMRTALEALTVGAARSGEELNRTNEIAAEVAQMRAALEALKSGAARSGEELNRTNEIAADVAGLKQEMSSLGEAMREMTGRAYSEAPNFSADIAHMKAEMVQLSIAMREMAAELPRAKAYEPAPAANDEIGDLKSSVQALIMLVSQSLLRPGEAA